MNMFMGKNSIKVERDCNELEAIAQKPLCNEPPGLQKNVMKLQKYSLNVKYRPSKELSRYAFKNTYK